MFRNRGGIKICLAALIVLSCVLVLKATGQDGRHSLPTGDVQGSPAVSVPAVRADEGTDGARAEFTPDDAKNGDSAAQPNATEKPERDRSERTPTPVSKQNKKADRPAKSGKTSQPSKASKSGSSSKADKASRSGKASPEENNSKARKKNEKKSLPSAASSPTPTAAAGSQSDPTVQFQIVCTAIMDKKELWKDGIEDILPSDGIFYSGQTAVQKGDTVYDLLKRVCADNNLVMDSQFTPIYGTYYIRGIGHLYEFDCGENSGWRYSVNGAIPGMGCNRCEAHAGDTIVFFYDYHY